jgi:hypothetical protein
MEEEILKAILEELKGVRQDIGELRKTTDERLTSLNDRIDTLEKNTTERLDGLNASLVVLQQGLGGIRYELRGIKDILSERVIWNNDTISLDVQEGNVIHGVIHKHATK